eukprot:955931-Pyramimonas_sp.AAC.1
MSPVASGNGKGQSAARGPRSCSIITTSRTLSVGGLRGWPSPPSRACVRSVSILSGLSRECRCSIPGCTLWRLHQQ